MSRLQDQVRGVSERHQVARHIGVRDRDRSAARDLLTEDLNDTAA